MSCMAAYKAALARGSPGSEGAGVNLSVGSGLTLGPEQPPVGGLQDSEHLECHILLVIDLFLLPCLEKY